MALRSLIVFIVLITVAVVAGPVGVARAHTPTEGQILDDASGRAVRYHMSYDEHGIPVEHTEMLWGNYVDLEGNPAVGWHSHDPVTGNARRRPQPSANGSAG